MNKKNCELCGKNKARMYCESDQASLCWDCDTNVHCANFLVAKHSRNLLCNSCQSLTPWSASGPKLSPTLSLCNSCLENTSAAAVHLQNQNEERVEENYETETDEEEEYESESDSDDEYDDDNEDAGNQVVPLSSSPSISSSSTGSYGDISAGDGGDTAAVSSQWKKRLRESDCLHSEDEEACSSDLNCNNLLEENKGTSSSIGFLRPMKLLRTNELS
ncbi:uncharacterized protein LOC107813335 [Nicotiana tabacum]|uniref:B-box zinc finger protein 23 n=1 Tax=Nicotiana tabacum TaxID=4097 RepID=A0A1S4BZ19_TOBAC|nr:B-box zinc finger protein 23-like [Nicotiana tomentosiformis]XP_016494078.1 PREDICTED: B-box zinc finger protein 23-like [Nicotiana tabacum]